MAAYGNDLTDISDTDTGTPTEFTPYGLGSSPAVDLENYIQGVGCFSQATGQKSGLSFSIVYDAGSDISGSFTTDDVVLVWLYYAVGVNLATYANGGLRFGIGSSLANIDSYILGGSDYGRNPYGGWINAVVDPTLAGDVVDGAGNLGAWQYFGAIGNFLVKITKGSPFAMDAIRYGRGEIYCTGTACDFTGLAAYNDLNTSGNYNRWGLFSEQGGTYLWKGLLSFGQSGTSATFSDSNKTIIVDDAAKTYATFNKLAVRNASTSVTLTNVTFIALGTVAPGLVDVTENATLVWTGCAFNSMSTFSFLSNSDILGCTFNSCGAITANGSDFTGTKVLASGVGADTAAFVWDSSADTGGLLDGMEFSKGAALHHAIEFTTAHAGGSFALNDIAFGTDWGADTTTSATFYFPDTGTDVDWVLDLSGVTGTTTYKKVRAGDTVTINSGVPTVVQGVTEGTTIRMEALETVGSVTVGDAIMVGQANESGVVSAASHAYSADIDVRTTARNSGLFPSVVQYDAAVYTNKTSEANTSTADTVDLFVDSGVALVGDAHYFGSLEEPTGVVLNISTAGTGTYTIDWEYWNGAWVSLSNVVADTGYGDVDLKTLQKTKLSWTPPSDWATTSVTNDNTTTALYWFRAVIATASTTITPDASHATARGITRYLPFTQDGTIGSTGLTVQAVWIEDPFATS